MNIFAIIPALNPLDPSPYLAPQILAIVRVFYIYIYIYKDCHPACKRCGGPDSTHCSDCHADMALASTGECICTDPAKFNMKGTCSDYCHPQLSTLYIYIYIYIFVHRLCGI